MPIRMTGMVSGLDTDSIVKELVSAYSTKKEKYEKEQTKLGWKQEIWKSLNKEVNSFYKSVGNLRFDSVIFCAPLIELLLRFLPAVGGA